MGAGGGGGIRKWIGDGVEESESTTIDLEPEVWVLVPLVSRATS